MRLLRSPKYGKGGVPFNPQAPSPPPPPPIPDISMCMSRETKQQLTSCSGGTSIRHDRRGRVAPPPALGDGSDVPLQGRDERHDRTDLGGLPLLGEYLREEPVLEGLDVHVGLVALDDHDRLAGLDLVALGLEPRDDPPLLHRGGQRRHGDLDRLCVQGRGGRPAAASLPAPPPRGGSDDEGGGRRRDGHRRSRRRHEGGRGVGSRPG